MLIGLVAAAIFISGIAIREIGFGGPLFETNQLQSDLVADILPPPAYIIEPFLETTVIVEDQTLDGHADTLVNLRKAYEERKAYWRTAKISDTLKAQLEVTHKSADAFWTTTDSLLAAAQAGDWVGAKLIHDTRLSPEYLTHRAEINKLVTMAATEKQALDKHSALLLYIAIGGLLVSAAAIVGALVFGAKQISKRIVEPVNETAAQMRAMAEGNYDIAITGQEGLGGAHLGAGHAGVPRSGHRQGRG